MGGLSRFFGAVLGAAVLVGASVPARATAITGTGSASLVYGGLTYTVAGTAPCIYSISGTASVGTQTAIAGSNTVCLGAGAGGQNLLMVGNGTNNGVVFETDPTASPLNSPLATGGSSTLGKGDLTLQVTISAGGGLAIYGVTGVSLGTTSGTAKIGAGLTVFNGATTIGSATISATGGATSGTGAAMFTPVIGQTISVTIDTYGLSTSTGTLGSETSFALTPLVPEPATMTLFGSALAGFLAMGRRRKS